MNKIDLGGRVAIVTGGAQGIGFAVAERFVQSGAKLAIWDRDKSELAEARKKLGGEVLDIAVDIRDADATSAAAAETHKKLGRIDILAHSAGIAGPTVPTVDYPLEAWREVIDIDLNGTFHCCRAVVPFMQQQNYGRIVNIASIAGKEGNPNASAYSAAKAGVIALTKSLGKELAGHQHRRELRHAGGGAHPHLRPDQPAAYRLHAGKDPPRPVPGGRRRSPT